MRRRNPNNNKINEKPKLSEEEDKDDDEEDIEDCVYEEDIQKIISDNNIINNEEIENINILNGPNIQNQNQQMEQNNIPKVKFNEILEVVYEKIPYQLFIYLKEDNTLVIELIPKEGHLPHSYKSTFTEKTFYDINSIFMELKTMEKIAQKLINLFNKKRVSIAKDKKEDKFYLILKITIIDEDKEILLPLNKNDSIQVCTINYLLRETKEIKKIFIEAKNESKENIKKQLEEIKQLKKINQYYINLINKIKKKNHEEEITDEDEEDIKNKNKDDYDENFYIDKGSLKKITQTIIDQNEEYVKAKNSINKIEYHFNSLINNFKCEVGPKNIILNLDINHIKPYILIHFEIENIGNYALSSKYDDLFCNIEGISSEIIGFYSFSEKYIYLNQSFAPKQKINVCKKFIIKKPKIDTKYEFFINFFTLSHGKISVSPIKVIIYIRSEEEKEDNFISFLNNKKIDYDIKNKKIIFEYFEEGEKSNENNKDMVDIGTGFKKQRIKIYKYLYDTKSGMAENKDEDKDKIDAFVVINLNDIDRLIKKIYDKYKESKKIEKYKLKDIICTCAGDFQKICDLIEKIKN